MKKTVIVACFDEEVKRIIKNGFSECRLIKDFVECISEKEVLMNSRQTEESIIFTDKYFYGYMFENKIFELKYFNPKCFICFCDSGDCLVHYGLRLYTLKADAYIADIQKTDHLVKELRTVMAGVKTFPERVQRDIDNKLAGYEKKEVSDITLLEERIAAMLGSGMNQMEIGYELHMKKQTVSNHVTNIRRKTGCRTPWDLYKLNQVAFWQGR